MSNGNDEHIEIVPNGESDGWSITIGQEAISLLDRIGLPSETRETVRNEAVSVLSKCVPPTSLDGQNTGLVLGYVQSGKTLSFTTVAALARDNNYPMVIVIAGSSKPLTTQSQQRLVGDLMLEKRSDRQWRHLHNPQIANQDHERIKSTLADWRDPDVPAEERSTMLVTVMKHHGRLNYLIQVLNQVDLTHIPVLIIDDEADQAGLNNLINQGDESTTYQRLCDLKNSVPHHTFLQYTATPQGPLLINLIDMLSPGFACTLTPGTDYVGGKDFFLDNTPLVQKILPQEIPSQDNILTEPPDSLLLALRLFFLGVASGIIRDQGRGNRSMMVHPSQRTDKHGEYFNWVRNVRDNWMQLLENPSDPDFQELREDFQAAYADLQTTVPDIEPFDQLMQRLRHAIRRTDMYEVNAKRGQTPQIDWRGAYAHILVGGQALDRGYTVEGLTVTYMPRGIGAGRADTIQQRARFFGYKRPYLGFCRVFLEQALSSALTRYVQHEENIRSQLAEFAQERRPLDELRRVFLLPRGLSATRDSIIDIDYVRARFNEGWFWPRTPQDDAQAVESNRAAIQQYLETLELELDEGHADRTPMQQHTVAFDVSLCEVYEHLLLDLRFPRLSDTQNLLGVLVIIRQHLDDNPDATCSIYCMSGGEPRVRTLNDRGEIPTLFQGAAPVNPPEQRGEIYPGDRYIHTDDQIAIQLHVLNLRNRGSSDVVHERVNSIAVWIPQGLSGDVLIQDQGGIEEAEDE